MDVLLGLDLGTTNCKALAFDLEGGLAASAVAPTPICAGSDPGSPEYDGSGLWHTAFGLIREVTGQLGPNRRVAALAVASMGESGVLVDASGEPLFPVITWHDRRTAPWAAWWRERMAEEEIYRITGLPQDHIYSAHKLLWYREKNPAAFARARSFLCLADWVTYKLTGQASTSYSMACRTMLFDLRALAWSHDLLDVARLPVGLLPLPLPSGEIAGRVTPEAAQATGLATGTPVVAGGHDHICAALAAGVIAPGPLLNSSGTADALLVTLDEAPAVEGLAARSGLCCGCHTARNRYYLLAGFVSGGVVSWLCRTLAGEDSPAALSTLLAEAAAAEPGARGLVFLPDLACGGPPDRDPDSWGAWLGLRLEHTRGDLVRAAFEGLSLALRRLMDAFAETTGHTAGELRAVGGGSRNTWWLQLKADVLGLPVTVPGLSEFTARGAALLAGLGAGIYADDAEAAATSYQASSRYDPETSRKTYYSGLYRVVFRELRVRLRDLPSAEEWICTERSHNDKERTYDR
jgi:xylulokinase